MTLDKVVFRDSPVSGDVTAVRNIVTRTRMFRPEEVDVAAELVEERLAKGLDSGYLFWFADIAGAPVGYVSYGPTPCTVGTYDLYWIAVDVSYQGLSIGRRLEQMAAESVKLVGGRRLYVETSGKEQYAPTREFYRRMGYDVAAVLPDFYDDGDDKVIFQKTF